MEHELPSLILTRIPGHLAATAKKIGRETGFRRSQVINLAIEHGLPIAKSKLTGLAKKP
jgi:hypothetical protein